MILKFNLHIDMLSMIHHCTNSLQVKPSCRLPGQADADLVDSNFVLKIQIGSVVTLD